MWSDPQVGKMPWSRKWQPTPVFLPGKFHGQRSLMGYSQWGCKELDTTQHAHTHTHTHTRTHTHKVNLYTGTHKTENTAAEHISQI